MGRPGYVTVYVRVSRVRQRGIHADARCQAQNAGRCLVRWHVCVSDLRRGVPESVRGHGSATLRVRPGRCVRHVYVLLAVRGAAHTVDDLQRSVSDLRHR